MRDTVVNSGSMLRRRHKLTTSVLLVIYLRDASKKGESVQKVDACILHELRVQTTISSFGYAS